MLLGTTKDIELRERSLVLINRFSVYLPDANYASKNARDASHSLFNAIRACDVDCAFARSVGYDVGGFEHAVYVKGYEPVRYNPDSGFEIISYPYGMLMDGMSFYSALCYLVEPSKVLHMLGE